MIANERTLENPIPPIVPVKPEARRQWQHLLTEAVMRGLAVRELDSEIEGGRFLLRYQVASHTVPGTYYAVTIERWAGGATGTRCGCQAGTFGKPCTHAALALDEARVWPDGMVIARQAGLPTNDERYEFFVGERVQIRGTQREGVVSGVRVLDARPAYRVDDPVEHRELGLFLSYELQPAPIRQHVPQVDQALGLSVLLAPKGGR
jgi:hypothetical protein